MGLGTSGIALAGWFFFFSVNEYKFLWGFTFSCEIPGGVSDISIFICIYL